MSKTTFFPNLDGLRFFAFLVVFFYHSGHTEYSYIKQDTIYKFVKSGLFSNGDLGVNFFFVLSGFLITYLLLAEEKKTNRIDVPTFYLRRVLRIWPLFYFCVVFGFFIFPQIKLLFNIIPNETAELKYFVTFLSNFNNIENGLPDASVLGVLWSVSIEEQFYLIWPLLIIIFKKNRNLLFIGLILFSTAFRYYSIQTGKGETHLDSHTILAMTDLTIGGYIGWLAYTNDKFINYFKNLPKTHIYIGYILLIILLLFRKDFQGFQFFLLIERISFCILFAFIILEQNFSANSFYKMGNNRFASNWGKYTYGLYCLHFIAILTTTNLSKLLSTNKTVFNVLVLETLFSFLLSLAISWISYHLYEKHFLKLKEKYGYKKAIN